MGAAHQGLVLSISCDGTDRGKYTIEGRAPMDDSAMSRLPAAPAGEPARGERRFSARHADQLLATTQALLREAIGHASSYQDTLAAITELVHAATHDTLTGLPTRGVLLNRLESALARQASAPEQVAVLFIDLDNFKLVNDSLGHDSGDALLREVARRISACAAPGDTVSRFGGDELVILHVCASHGSEVALAQQVLASMAEPISVAGRELVTSVSVGLASCVPGAQSAEQLLRDADTALYAAKSKGRNRMERFNQALHARVVRRMRIESDLRVALRDAQIEVHYQPQVNLETGFLVGMEALARWRHPELGPISPMEFIPVAEESRLIAQLGRQVLHSACRQLAVWAAASPDRPMSMTVNISPRQLEDAGFIANLRQILDDSGINPASLCLELTESALMKHEANIVEVLQQALAMGVYVAIDDFGTEHSSLSRLRGLPVEVLKIDRSFIDGLPNDPDDMAIVSSILSLAFAMGKHVIAEGVERPEQALALRHMGCMVVQGYLFSMPVEPAAIEPLLNRQLWQPPASWTEPMGAVASSTASRRAYTAFIDEFLYHIGAPMAQRRAANS